MSSSKVLSRPSRTTWAFASQSRGGLHVSGAPTVVVTLLLTLSDNAHSIPFQQLRWTWIHVLSVVLFVSQLLWVLIVQSSSHYGESVYSMVVWFCHIFVDPDMSGSIVHILTTKLKPSLIIKKQARQSYIQLTSTNRFAHGVTQWPMSSLPKMVFPSPPGVGHRWTHRQRGQATWRQRSTLALTVAPS